MCSTRGPRFCAGLTAIALVTAAVLTISGLTPPAPTQHTLGLLVPGHTAQVPPSVEALDAFHSDDFDNGVIDPFKWEIFETSDSYVAERNGRLEVTHSAFAAGFEAGIRSREPMAGDFDLRVEYSLVKYPVTNTDGKVVELEPDARIQESNGVRVGVTISRPSEDFPVTVERSSPEGTPEEVYAADWQGAVLFRETRDRTGSLRIERTGGIVALYYAYEDFWVELRRGEWTDENLSLSILSWAQVGALTPDTVVVAFDNLTAYGPEPDSFPSPEAVQLQILANPSSGPAPLGVNFSSAVTGGRLPYSYAWTFGDGGTSPRSEPTHVYHSAGDYEVTLTVTDADGRTAETASRVSVTGTGGPTWLAYVAVAGIPIAGPLAWLLWRRSRTLREPSGPRDKKE